MDFKTVQIGNQTWMVENLSVDDNGEGIFHHGDQVYYTWEAAMRVAKSLKGWHLPSKEEFDSLFRAVGGEADAGKMLKSTTGWNYDGNGDDAFGFTALPAGYRHHYGYMYGDGDEAYFWSSTEIKSDCAYSMYLDYEFDMAVLSNYGYGKSFGFSVRLVKDEEGK